MHLPAFDFVSGLKDSMAIKLQHRMSSSTMARACAAKPMLVLGRSPPASLRCSAKQQGSSSEKVWQGGCAAYALLQRSLLDIGGDLRWKGSVELTSSRCLSVPGLQVDLMALALATAASFTLVCSPAMANDDVRPSCARWHAKSSMRQNEYHSPRVYYTLSGGLQGASPLLLLLLCRT